MLDLIRCQILTEKTNSLLKYNKYCFEVSLEVNKSEIKSLIENTFGVKVLKVTTSIMPSKSKTLGKYFGNIHSKKRVIVKISEKNVIPFFS
uniref:Large ribosomal subunit protein uL23c n=1 Tax=Trachelomonas grandis TaxID=215769 RepID=A0A385UK28_9EUGL|nr:ribosomal protein L23 [Trachelomonas grandis]